MCLSGRLGNCVILSKSCNVQSCSGCCWRYVLHSTGEGLIVTTIAYMSRGGGWLLWRCMWVYRYGRESIIWACRGCVVWRSG
jgi:hypothetical protein